MPPNLPPELRRALRACTKGQWDKAERLCGAVLADHPDNFDALHCLGEINFRRGRLDAALALFQAALKADLSRADGFASLGLVFHALGQHERALISYDEGLRIDPDNAELLNRRGVALLELKRPQRARESFERALTCEELALRARLDLDEGRSPAAALQVLIALDAALAELPGDPAASALEERLVELRALHDGVAAAARAALHGESATDRDAVALALGRLEAALRARAGPLRGGR